MAWRALRTRRAGPGSSGQQRARIRDMRPIRGGSRGCLSRPGSVTAGLLRRYLRSWAPNWALRYDTILPPGKPRSPGPGRAQASRAGYKTPPTRRPMADSPITCCSRSHSTSWHKASIPATAAHGPRSGRSTGHSGPRARRRAPLATGAGELSRAPGPAPGGDRVIQRVTS